VDGELNMEIITRTSEIPPNANVIRVPLIEAMRLARVDREKKRRKDQYEKNKDRERKKQRKYYRKNKKRIVASRKATRALNRIRVTTDGS